MVSVRAFSYLPNDNNLRRYIDFGHLVFAIRLFNRDKPDDPRHLVLRTVPLQIDQKPQALVQHQLRLRHTSLRLFQVHNQLQSRSHHQ